MFLVTFTATSGTAKLLVSSKEKSGLQGEIVVVKVTDRMNARSEMKVFLFTIVLAALIAGLARAQVRYNQPCKVGACAYSKSKECRDARNAFAEHHNGLYPEQWCNQWYQGQQGRWNQQGNKWQWEGAEGDQWFQGRQGHWFQEHDGWQFRGDKGDEYRKGRNGWQWSGARQKHKSGS